MDDDSLPGLWGLPATSLIHGETEEEAVRRAGREKLGVAVLPLDAIGSESTMTDWTASIETGEPSVPQPAQGTQYTALRFGTPADLIPTASAGSLCCRVLLRARGIDWEE